jgi:hypothetical protein
VRYSAPQTMFRLSPWNSALLVFLVLILATGMTYYHLGPFLSYAEQVRAAKQMDGGYSFGNDFYPIWLTSREALLHHRNPYTPEMTRDIQRGLFGRPLDARNSTDPPLECRVFAYPAYADVIFWPISLLPFPVVRAVLAAVLAGATVASILLWLKALDWQMSAPALAIVMMLTLSSYAVLEGLFAAQPGLLVGLLLAGSCYALVRNRLFLAGSLMAFTLIKPQMSVLLAVYLLLWAFSDWRRRRSFLMSF